MHHTHRNTQKKEKITCTQALENESETVTDLQFSEKRLPSDNYDWFSPLASKELSPEAPLGSATAANPGVDLWERKAQQKKAERRANRKPRNGARIDTSSLFSAGHIDRRRRIWRTRDNCVLGLARATGTTGHCCDWCSFCETRNVWERLICSPVVLESRPYPWPRSR